MNGIYEIVCGFFYFIFFLNFFYYFLKKLSLSLSLSLPPQAFFVWPGWFGAMQQDSDIWGASEGSWKHQQFPADFGKVHCRAPQQPRWKVGMFCGRKWLHIEHCDNIRVWWFADPVFKGVDDISFKYAAVVAPIPWSWITPTLHIWTFLALPVVLWRNC